MTMTTDYVLDVLDELKDIGITEQSLARVAHELCDHMQGAMQ